MAGLNGSELVHLFADDLTEYAIVVVDSTDKILAWNAGARALLVTHWAVDSAAATRLTIATFDRLKADPKLGRAEALRQAMLAYLGDTSSPRNAYPAFWAPFALIGEGATR